MFEIFGIIGCMISPSNVLNVFEIEILCFTRQYIYIYSAAARRRCGGAMAALNVSNFRHMSMFNTTLYSSIVDTLARSNGHISKCAQIKQKTPL